jgi:hypothetical protein
MACSAYVDESSWSLVVQISNQRQQAVYVSQRNADCETTRPFEVRDGSRTLLPALEKCPVSCQQLMQAAPTTCPAACPAPSTLTIQPGETVKVPWDGRFAVPHSLPAQCASAAAQGTTSCVQAAHIGAGVFTFSARAGTSRACANGSTSCTCTPGPNGGCVTAGSVIDGTIITTEYLVNLEPAEVSPGGEPPFIGLVFRD